MSEPQTERQPLGQWTKMALEVGPIVVFILANKYGEQLAESYPALQAFGGKIFIATGFFMVAMTISLILTWMFERRVAIMPLVTFGMVADLPPRSVCFPWKRAAPVAHTKVIRAIGGCVCARNESSVEMDGLGDRRRDDPARRLVRSMPWAA